MAVQTKMQQETRGSVDEFNRDYVAVETTPTAARTPVSIDANAGNRLLDLLEKSAQTLRHTAESVENRGLKLLLKVMAQGYSVEAGNVRHEHEWKIWQNTKLPDGKLVIPGVVSHATNVLEHPELVADRIVRFAKVVGRENVIASTDCGLGGRVHPQIAWAKLGALAEGARLATKQLWA